MAFRKKLNKEQYDILIYDLDCIEFEKTKDNLYHYNLLRGNLMDLAGVKK